jgi:hypothetical protein
MLVEINVWLRVGEVFKVQKYRYGKHVDFFSYLLIEKEFNWANTASYADKLKFGRHNVVEALNTKKLERILDWNNPIYGVCIDQKKQQSIIYFFENEVEKETLIASISKLGDAGQKLLELYNEKIDDEKPNILTYIDDYYPYWSEEGIRNPKFDKHSNYIIELKKRNRYAIDHFYQILNKELKQNVTICIVPSSDATKIESGIRDLGQKLAAQNGRVDGTHCLRRHTSIEKASNGGPRFIRAHLDSICIEDRGLIEGRRIVLLDDIATSESSISACHQLLQYAGARKVEKLVLGYTTR